MEVFKSLYVLAAGILRRFWVWTPSLILDPYDLWARLVKPMGVNFDLPWSPDWAPAILVALIAWAAVLTFHELRQRTLCDDTQPTDSVRWLFGYMLTDTKWALDRCVDLDNPHQTGGGLYHALQKELGDAASMGALDVWARSQERAGFSPRLSKFSPEDWASLFFDLPTCMGVGESAVVYDSSNARAIYYEDAQIDRHQVLKIWPKASLLQRFRDKTRKGRLAFVKEESHGDLYVAR